MIKCNIDGTEGEFTPPNHSKPSYVASLARTKSFETKNTSDVANEIQNNITAEILRNDIEEDAINDRYRPKDKENASQFLQYRFSDFLERDDVKLFIQAKIFEKISANLNGTELQKSAINDVLVDKALQNHPFSQDLGDNCRSQLKNETVKSIELYIEKAVDKELQKQNLLNSRHSSSMLI